MEWLAFILAVVAAGVVGILAGLAVAPRLTRWTDRNEATQGAEGGAGDGTGVGNGGEDGGD